MFRIGWGKDVMLLNKTLHIHVQADSNQVQARIGTFDYTLITQTFFAPS